ncbi:MAG: urease accessory protein UreF [Candidatus Competibacteraceae bacterium]|uniref:Urease accessory protein UreF n=1 Tax=Candidatus Contendobacter odensis Run_B_J11 TaxID=1400861 RepID=A0A7U7J4I9_9GAMM|nr:urease accessory UreF family protein [Candidatus Contendobacter odensis]MBK8536211.1 urease accessory protein UreF [Candidatus Competibacteraceae bacterium]MBK8751408.1 urease accessory protein UreF [Candidatus Competibacteraceae bacterium]CDH47316.1 Urease accessory protein UreF [Candidatus Contendobacter odensis Run_B_J11]
MPLTLPSLLRLLQLCSPTLPVGAYAYSQGLEYAVDRGWVRDETSAGEWILGLLNHSVRRLDVPVLARLYRGWQETDAEAVQRWNARLYASREAAELQQEDRHLGTALARLLVDLGLNEATSWRNAPQVCFATLFSLAAVRWEIPLPEAATGYAWAWTENQIIAATRLIPLGQTASQRLLVAAGSAIAAAVVDGLTLADEEIGAAAPGLALAGILHETQYSRLFRS